MAVGVITDNVPFFVHPPDQIRVFFDKLLKRIHPGAIVLLHSTSSTNAQILDELLTKWEELGYEFRALDELK